VIFDSTIRLARDKKHEIRFYETYFIVEEGAWFALRPLAMVEVSSLHKSGVLLALWCQSPNGAEDLATLLLILFGREVGSKNNTMTTDIDSRNLAM
jgi:hypothetical protein